MRDGSSCMGRHPTVAPLPVFVVSAKTVPQSNTSSPIQHRSRRGLQECSSFSAKMGRRADPASRSDSRPRWGRRPVERDERQRGSRARRDAENAAGGREPRPRPWGAEAASRSDRWPRWGRRPTQRKRSPAAKRGASAAGTRVSARGGSAPSDSSAPSEGSLRSCRSGVRGVGRRGGRRGSRRR